MARMKFSELTKASCLKLNSIVLCFPGRLKKRGEENERGGQVLIGGHRAGEVVAMARKRKERTPKTEEVADQKGRCAEPKTSCKRDARRGEYAAALKDAVGDGGSGTERAARQGQGRNKRGMMDELAKERGLLREAEQLSFGNEGSA